MIAKGLNNMEWMNGEDGENRLNFRYRNKCKYCNSINKYNYHYRQFATKKS